MYGLVHATIIFFVTFIGLEDSGIFNPDKGYSTTLWTTSVATFTSLVFAVNINLMTRMRYLTSLHFLSLAICSFGAYVGYMWFTNYVEIGVTQDVILESHYSVLFYFCVFFSVTTCFALDYFKEATKVLLFTSPTDFLRRLVSSKKTINSKENQE